MNHNKNTTFSNYFHSKKLFVRNLDTKVSNLHTLNSLGINLEIVFSFLKKKISFFFSFILSPWWVPANDRAYKKGAIGDGSVGEGARWIAPDHRCVPVCLCACVPVCLCVCVPVCLRACVPVCLSVCLSG